MRPPLTDEPLISRRALVIAGAVVAAGVGTWIVVDLLVVTDEERLEDFSDAVTGTLERDRIADAMRYFNPAVVPLTVEVQGSTYHFGPDEGPGFQAEARSRLAPYNGLHLGLLGRTIDVRDDSAHVVLHTFSRRGRNTIDVDLRKREGSWFVSYLKII